MSFRMTFMVFHKCALFRNLILMRWCLLDLFLAMIVLDFLPKLLHLLPCVFSTLYALDAQRSRYLLSVMLSLIEFLFLSLCLHISLS